MPVCARILEILQVPARTDIRQVDGAESHCESGGIGVQDKARSILEVRIDNAAVAVEVEVGLCFLKGEIPSIPIQHYGLVFDRPNDIVVRGKVAGGDVLIDRLALVGHKDVLGEQKLLMRFSARDGDQSASCGGKNIVAHGIHRAVVLVVAVL